MYNEASGGTKSVRREKYTSRLLQVVFAFSNSVFDYIYSSFWYPSTIDYVEILYAYLQHLVCMQARRKQNWSLLFWNAHKYSLSPIISALMGSTYVVADIVTPNHAETKAKAKSIFFWFILIFYICL